MSHDKQNRPVAQARKACDRWRFELAKNPLQERRQQQVGLDRLAHCKEKLHTLVLA
jgi:hypothetical protein